MEEQFTTERLSWRTIRPSDAPMVHLFASDFEVVKSTGRWPWPADPVFTESRCQPPAPARGLSGVVLLDGDVIGSMGIDAAKMGYMIARPHWGKGYATEIARALTAHAFARYDWPAIKAGVWLDNPASSRVLEKIGFHPAGERISHCVARGQDLPLRDYLLPRPPR